MVSVIIYCLQYSYRERYSKHSNCSSLGNSSICINGEEQDSVTSLSTKTKVRTNNTQKQKLKKYLLNFFNFNLFYKIFSIKLKS